MKHKSWMSDLTPARIEKKSDAVYSLSKFILTLKLIITDVVVVKFLVFFKAYFSNNKRKGKQNTENGKGDENTKPPPDDTNRSNEHK